MQQPAREIARLSCRGKLHISEDVVRASYLHSHGIEIANILDSDDDDTGMMLLYDAMVLPYTWQDMQSDTARRKRFCT